jgi:hypothetical protein
MVAELAMCIRTDLGPGAVPPHRLRRNVTRAIVQAYAAAQLLR